MHKLEGFHSMYSSLIVFLNVFECEEIKYNKQSGFFFHTKNTSLCHFFSFFPLTRSLNSFSMPSICAIPTTATTFPPLLDSGKWLDYPWSIVPSVVIYIRRNSPGSSFCSKGSSFPCLQPFILS